MEKMNGLVVHTLSDSLVLLQIPVCVMSIVMLVMDSLRPDRLRLVYTLNVT